LKLAIIKKLKQENEEGIAFLNDGLGDMSVNEIN
jgi:hypothetical protein